MPEIHTDLLTVREAAAFLRLSERQVYRLRETGELPIVRMGSRVLIRRDDLDRFITRCSEAG